LTSVTDLDKSTEASQEKSKYNSALSITGIQYGVKEGSFTRRKSESSSMRTCHNRSRKKENYSEKKWQRRGAWERLREWLEIKSSLTVPTTFLDPTECSRNRRRESIGQIDKDRAE